MRNGIFALTLFSSSIYFSVASIMGLDMEEEGSGTIYKIYCILIFLLSMITYACCYLKKQFSSRHIVSLLIVFLYIIIGLWEGYSNDKSWLCLVAFCLPATCIAVYYAENEKIGNLVRWIDILIPFFAVSLFFSINKLFIDILGGTGYYSQSLSYLAANCFLLDLFILLFGNKYERFSFFRKKTYLVISVLLLPYFLLIQFFAGGRGALGTLVVGIIGIIYVYKKTYPYKNLHIMSISVFIILLGLLGGSLLSGDAFDVLSKNSERVFSFFSSGKDLYERTSGRDIVFQAAMDMIYERPLFGYGLFAYKDPPSFFIAGYPHNIILEILLQGGLSLLIVFVVLISNVYFKLLRIIKDLSQSLVLLFFVFCITLLMYSGSYIENSFFWFSVVFVLNHRSHNKKEMI